MAADAIVSIKLNEGFGSKLHIASEDDSNQSSVLLNKFSSGSSSIAMDDSSADGSAMEPKGGNGQLRRIKSALSPQSSWLKKFSIRRVDDPMNPATATPINNQI